MGIIWSHHSVILFLILVISTTPHLRLFNAQGRKLVAQTPDYSKEEKATWRVPIGSRPPRCDRKCDSCSHCEAIQVPENPPRAENSTSVVINGRDYGNSNYKPMSWKCKCGNLFFNP